MTDRPTDWNLTNAVPRVRSVLIVDDDARVLRSCERSLKSDRKVYTTNDPSRALTLVRSYKPDAVIVDLRLGGQESGIDLIRALRQLHPDVKVALLSGYLSVTVTMAAVKAGAEVVLSKPVGAREIVRHLEEGTTPEPDIYETPTLERVEWEHINRVVADTSGNLSEAARRLGIYRQTLQRRLQRKPPKTGR
ncbi:MAG: response regulator [Kofleriaceae bacterium]